MRDKTLLLAAAAAGCVLLGLTQPEPRPKPVGPIVLEAKSALESLSFLKGSWSGKSGNDWVEETWSAAHGDSIIGMFRWQVDGKQTSMWELLSITDEGGKPVLRLRHFDSKFEPWKSETGPVEPMPAAELSPGRALFSAERGGLKSVEYKSPKPDVLEITVTFRDAGREPLELDLRRQ
jgi:hypothetical protein